MKFFSFLAGAAALLLTAGCAFSEFKTTSAPVEDPRIRFADNGRFSLKPLRVVTSVDDEGCLNADVTFELGGSPFLTWFFRGTPMQTLHYRFDWVDAKGAVVNGPLRKVDLLPGNILSLGAIAPSEKYTDFKFEVFFCSDPGACPDEKSACCKDAKSCCKDGKVCCKDGKTCCCSGGKACACKDCCCKDGKSACCKDGKSACCKDGKNAKCAAAPAKCAKKDCCKSGKACCKDGKPCCCSGGKACACKECCCKSGKGCCKDGKSACCKADAKCVKKDAKKPAAAAPAKSAPAPQAKKPAAAPAKVPANSSTAVKPDGKLAESLN
ncbi:MAG: hypothetical protein J6331_05765 [Lentisphaeria bacterium]|nr:hypothetical protein [Lentisphaeria bacterium]